MLKYSFGLFGTLAVFATHASAQTLPPVMVGLPFAEIRPLNGTEADTTRPVLRVTVEGGQEFLLPAAEDTWFWKDKVDDRSRDASLAIRSGRLAQALLKFDLSALPAGVVIQRAQLEGYIGWQEKEGNAKLNVFRMLTDWSETASFAKPKPEQARAWNGMKPGEDYEAAPSATLDIPEVKRSKIAIPGLENVVRGWATNPASNFGLAIQMAGSAVQVNLDSSEGKERNPTPLILGGPGDAKILLRPDPVLMQRPLMRPSDLLSAGVAINLSRPPAAVYRGGIKVLAHRMLKAEPGISPIAGVDYEASPVASVPLESLTAENWLKLPNVGALVTAPNSPGVLLSMSYEATDPKKARPKLSVNDTRDTKTQPLLELSVVNYPKATLFPAGVKPRPGVYNTLKNGNFDYGGERLRLWGTLGGAHDADRLRKMGFNAWRLWRAPKLYTVESARRGEVAPREPGAEVEQYDKFFASLKQHGMFVMFAGLTTNMPIKEIAVDGAFIAPAADASAAEKADWEAWKEGVKKASDSHLQDYFLYFDPRLQKIKRTHARNFLNHVNPITGKSYAQDEAIAIIEIFNESGFLKKTLERGWKSWPPYFQEQFRVRWNEWLQRKYKDQPALLAAWGRVNEGENLGTGSIKLGPISAQAREYPEARGGDFTRFVMDVVNGYNQDFEKYCRTLAPTGIGVNVVPFSYDTQYMPSVQWAYNKNGGQVNCFGMYSWDLSSVLGRPPGNYVMDSHDVEGKATVIYETNQSRPDPYRAEYPFRTAALASWQDWDGIFWHYWGAGEFRQDEDYLVKSMPQLTASHYWTGVHHQNDPIMTTAMALAGQIFLNGDIAPASNPAIYEVGAKTLFNFNRYNALGLGQVTYSTGSRLRFKPESNTEVTVNGGPPPEVQRITAAVRSGQDVLWDWPNERLIIDTPTAKVYVGRTAASYTFKDGITLSGFNQPWISWCMLSTDGRPLTGVNATSKVLVNGVFDARNTGFEYKWGVTGGPLEQAGAILNRGRAPIIVDKVSYTVSFPTQLNHELASYDFALRQTANTRSNTNVIRVKADENWMHTLNITGRGAARPAVVDASPGVPTVVAGASTTGNGPDLLAGVFNPIPVLSWGDDYRSTHRKLRESAIRFIAIENEDLANPADKTLLWSGAEALFNAPADFEIIFAKGKMSKISATFKQAPDFNAAIAAYEQKFGPDAAKELNKAQFETNFARWQIKSEGREVSMLLTLSQGEVKAIYELK